MWVSVRVKGEDKDQVHHFNAYGEEWFLTRAFKRFGLWRLRKYGAWNEISGYNIYVFVSKNDRRLLGDMLPRWLFVFYWWAFFGMPSQRTIGMYLHMLELDIWDRKRKPANLQGEALHTAERGTKI